MSEEEWPGISRLAVRRSGFMTDAVNGIILDSPKLDADFAVPDMHGRFSQAGLMDRCGERKESAEGLLSTLAKQRSIRCI